MAEVAEVACLVVYWVVVAAEVACLVVYWVAAVVVVVVC